MKLFNDNAKKIKLLVGYEYLKDYYDLNENRYKNMLRHLQNDNLDNPYLKQMKSEFLQISGDVSKYIKSLFKDTNYSTIELDANFYDDDVLLMTPCFVFNIVFYGDNFNLSEELKDEIIEKLDEKLVILGLYSNLD